MTTVSPASPNRPANISSTVASASAVLVAITTPLPAASPLALMTIGSGCARSHPASKSARVKLRYCAVGILWRRRNSLANDFEPSSCAQARLGPKQARPAAWKASTSPKTSGVSGPMIVSATLSARASATRPTMLSLATGALRTFNSVAVPALPGATSTSLTAGEAAHLQASACSRPPLPTIKTFIVALCNPIGFNAGNGACPCTPWPCRVRRPPRRLRRRASSRPAG